MRTAENPSVIPFLNSFLRCSVPDSFSLAVMALNAVFPPETMTLNFEIAFTVADAASFNQIHD